MINLFNKILLVFCTWVLKLVDFIFSLFRVAAGIENVNFKNGTDDFRSNILNGIMFQKTVYKVFFFMLLVGVAAGAIFTAFSIIRNMAKIKKSNSKIVMQYIGSILAMFVVFFLIFVFIYVISELLNAIMLAFSAGKTDNLSIGNKIIKAMGETSYYPDKVNQWNDLWKPDSIDAVGIYQSNFVDNFYGTLDKGLSFFDYTFNNGIVNAQTFQVFVVLVAACVIGWCSISAIIQLGIRIYDIVFMILVMPMPLAAYPLDDGERYKSWRKTMISKMFLAYGTIIAVNVYLLLVPIITSLTLPEGANLTTPNMGDGVNNTVFLFNLFKVFLIVAGGFTIAGGQLLFARLMGTDAEEGRQAQQTFRNAIAGIGSAAGIAKGAAKLAFGKGDKNKKGAGALSSATDGGGRFTGLGSGSVIKAAGKAGLVGAGVNIASRLGRSLFGSGSGSRALNKVASRVKSSGLYQGASSLGTMMKSKGVVKGLGYSKLAIEHGKNVARENKMVRIREKEAAISFESVRDKKEYKQRQKELDFAFRNAKDDE